MRSKRILRVLAFLLLLCIGFSASAEEATAGEAEPRKAAYLTFDDGPQPDTPELVSILEELDVPATFFYIGADVKRYPDMAKLVYEKGYSVGCHSMYHAVKRYKSDPQGMLRDAGKFEKAMQEYVDPAYKLTIYRFPYGSTRYSYSVKKGLCDAGISWIDWNCMTGDAAGMNFRNSKRMYEYTLRTIGDRDTVVLLMHENKKMTKEILPELVSYLREQGYEFRSFTGSEEDRKYLEDSGVNYMIPVSEGE